MFWSLLFVPLAVFTATASAYANPLTCTGTCTNCHDPDLIRRSSDNEYFRFSTGGGIAIHKASSIQGPWVYQGYALPSGSKIDNTGNQDLWAPDISHIDGTYYLYYAVSTFGTQISVIGLATSTTMEVGSWTDHGSVGVSSTKGKPYNAIDPNLVLAGSTYLLNFGSFWDDIYQVPMASTPTTTAGAGSYNIAYQPASTHAIEGAFMVENIGYYYLFFSEGQCCGLDTSRPAAGGEYKVMVCRSTSATGDFVDASGTSCANGGGTVVLESHGVVYAPGGQSVYYDSTDGWVLIYHYLNIDIGYADADVQLGVNYLEWENGWPVV